MADHGSTCLLPSTRASTVWDSNTSTSSTRIGTTPTRRSKKRWALWPTRFGGGRRCTQGSLHIHPPRPLILRAMGVPMLIHQPSYSLFNRWIEVELLDTLSDLGMGCIAFSILGQGLLTDRYLSGTPEGSRATNDESFDTGWLTEDVLARVRFLNDIAAERGQTLAQMAIAWSLRDQRVTSALIGASSVYQLEQSLGAVNNLDFTPDELEHIDRYAVDSGIDIWDTSRRAG